MRPSIELEPYTFGSTLHVRIVMFILVQIQISMLVHIPSTIQQHLHIQNACTRRVSIRRSLDVYRRSHVVYAFAQPICKRQFVIQ